MAKFSIRVELHNATRMDYAKLADSLRRFGIVDTIVGDNGIRYRLPPAEYNYEGEANIQDVQSAAQAAADGVSCSNAIYTSEATCRQWSGLANV